MSNEHRNFEYIYLDVVEKSTERIQSFVERYAKPTASLTELGRAFNLVSSNDWCIPSGPVDDAGLDDLDAYCGGHTPVSIRNFMSSIGRSGQVLDIGFPLEIPFIIDGREAYREWVVEMSEFEVDWYNAKKFLIPDNAIILGHHGGGDFFYVLDEQPDPTVWAMYEGQNSPGRLNRDRTFSTLVLMNFCTLPYWIRNRLELFAEPLTFNDTPTPKTVTAIEQMTVEERLRLALSLTGPGLMRIKQALLLDRSDASVGAAMAQTIIASQYDEDYELLCHSRGLMESRNYINPMITLEVQSPLERQRTGRVSNKLLAVLFSAIADRDLIKANGAIDLVQATGSPVNGIFDKEKSAALGNKYLENNVLELILNRGNLLSAAEFISESRLLVDSKSCADSESILVRQLCGGKEMDISTQLSVGQYVRGLVGSRLRMKFEASYSDMAVRLFCRPWYETSLEICKI